MIKTFGMGGLEYINKTTLLWQKFADFNFYFSFATWTFIDI